MRIKHGKFKVMCIITLLYFVNSQAQLNINTNPYWAGEIHLEDGTVKKGLVMVPNSSKENNIAFKANINGKKETVKRKIIKSIKVTSPNGKEYFFEHVPVVMAFSGDKSYTNSLLLVYKRNNLATFFVESGVYRIDSDTNEIYTLYRYVVGNDLPTVHFYIHKRGEENTFALCVTGNGFSGLNSKLRKSAQRHLTEDPILLKRIMDKELGHQDIYEIIDTYLKSTENL